MFIYVFYLSMSCIILFTNKKILIDYIIKGYAHMASELEDIVKIIYQIKEIRNLPKKLNLLLILTFRPRTPDIEY